MKLKPLKRLFRKYKSPELEDWIIGARRRYACRVLEKKIGGGNIQPLNMEERKEILDFWKEKGENTEKLFNLDQYSVYNKYKKGSEKLTDYIPDDFYYCYADTYFTNYHVSIKLDNKNMYDLYFNDVKLPECIVRKINGILMDSKYYAIDLETAVEKCIDKKNVIIKKAIDSDGGHGIQILDDCGSNREELIEALNHRDNYIVQTLIEQHPVLARFNPESVNTIRIMTLVLKGNVHVLSSVLRMGVNGARVDNASSGGIVCGIDISGTLKPVAYDSAANLLLKHPQGEDFEGTVTPSFHECVDTAKRLAPRFSNYTRLISWDFSVDSSGEPILIEANFTGGQLDFHQLCNGPIWGELTDTILSEILNESKDVNKIIRP